MKRNLAQLTTKKYDLIVVGAGVYGACVAWDAALRGLQVALIERGDFGHATSANSLKTVHGGLRYLQDANLKVVRLMIHERKSFLRIAPHLVHPLPCLMPTYPGLMRSKSAMQVALALNDLIGFDRNRLSDPQKHLPPGEVISRQACLEIVPGIVEKNLTGGAIWHDAQMYNTERMTLSFVLSAVQNGADAANYLPVVDFLKQDRRVNGVRVRDTLTGQKFEIRGELVINTAGPWVEQLLGLLQPDAKIDSCPSIAMNLVTRQIIPEYAVGLPSRYEYQDGQAIPLKRSRILFVAPWRNYSLIGTLHLPFDGSIDDYPVREQTIQNFIDEINAAYPDAALKREDVYFVHQGFLPAEENSDPAVVKLVRQGQVHDYASELGIEGLITVVGVKYTTARTVAQQAVDLAVKKLNRSTPACRTHLTPLYGGQIASFSDFLTQATRSRPETLDADVMRHLAYTYGSTYSQILRYLDEDVMWAERVSEQADVIRAEVVHAVRHEMARKLADVILRRTELGSAGWPGEAAVRVCAEIMAGDLGWDEPTVAQELDDVRKLYQLRHGLSARQKVL